MLAVDELLEQLLVEVVSMSVNQCAVVLRGPVLLKAHMIFKNKEQKQGFNLSKKEQFMYSFLKFEIYEKEQNVFFKDL